ncbi:MAG: 30S ribosomal protein S17 [Deltaproteobacteria bacterium]|nr:30S ribosomal protein S17 [Deltaproteobacteria bacterium]
MAEKEAKRGLAKTRQGRVISNKMDKTVVVAITTHKKHAQYGKYVLSTKKYVAHDDKNECQIGDLVSLIESRPLSKTKRWRVNQVVEKAV